jgi:hypothetical protein
VNKDTAFHGNSALEAFKMENLCHRTGNQMPVDDFEGTTFVAFTDISGFKEMMKTEERAVQALNRFYQTGYGILRRNDAVNGFFISDSGVLFVRDSILSEIEQLTSLLTIIQNINRSLLQFDIMLTTSIAYGEFNYHQRSEFLGIEKNPIYGEAYLSAFLDNESGRPKLQPGQCRIINSNLDRLQNYIDSNFHVDLHILSKLIKSRNHYYFYWMVEHQDQIDNFQQRYRDTYQLKYRGMLHALKEFL